MAMTPQYCRECGTSELLQMLGITSGIMKLRCINADAERFAQLAVGAWFTTPVRKGMFMKIEYCRRCMTNAVRLDGSGEDGCRDHFVDGVHVRPLGRIQRLIAGA